MRYRERDRRIYEKKETNSREINNKGRKGER